MTSTVTVSAHCGEDKEVFVLITDYFEGKETNNSEILQNGDTKIFYVYDNRTIRVGEIEKEV